MICRKLYGRGVGSLLLTPKLLGFLSLQSLYVLSDSASLFFIPLLLLLDLALFSCGMCLIDEL